MAASLARSKRSASAQSEHNSTSYSTSFVESGRPQPAHFCAKASASASVSVSITACPAVECGSRSCRQDQPGNRTAAICTTAWGAVGISFFPLLECVAWISYHAFSRQHHRCLQRRGGTQLLPHPSAMFVRGHPAVHDLLRSFPGRKPPENFQLHRTQDHRFLFAITNPASIASSV